MKLRTKSDFVWLLLVALLCAGRSLDAAEYENLFGRHHTQSRRTQVRFTADLLILGRTGVQDFDIVFSDPPGGPQTPLLGTADIDVDEAFLSGRYDLIVSDHSPFELQFTLTGFPGRRENSATRADPDIINTFFGRQFGSAPISDPAATTGLKQIRYNSNFGSGELNFRQQLGPRLTWFSGFRYLTLQEDLDSLSIDSTTGETVASTLTDADNELFGYQLGFESTVWTRGRTKVVVIGRGGVFHHQIETRLHSGALVPDPDNPDARETLSRETDETTFAGDLQAALTVPLGAGFLRLGYQVFWVNDVALLPNQLDDINFLTDTGTFDLTSTVYQGGFVGLEIPF